MQRAVPSHHFDLIPGFQTIIIERIPSLPNGCQHDAGVRVDLTGKINPSQDH